MTHPKDSEIQGKSMVATMNQGLTPTLMKHALFFRQFDLILRCAKLRRRIRCLTLIQILLKSDDPIKHFHGQVHGSVTGTGYWNHKPYLPRPLKCPSAVWCKQACEVTVAGGVINCQVLMLIPRHIKIRWAHCGERYSLALYYDKT